MAEDAGGLAPGKDDNAVWRKIDRKDGAISHASDYNGACKFFTQYLENREQERGSGLAF